jgi:transcriptional regulator with XRE-family HTH domain
MAEKLGITQQAFLRWETKKRKPKFETLQKIAEICSCDVMDLLK